MLSIYKASAGSGKTFTLAREYIKLLIGSRGDDGKWHLTPKRRDAHRAILAITFTNKATDEMKQRIIHELAVLAGMEPDWENGSPYTDYLTTTFEATAEQISQAAANALRNLLFDFNFFQISTIDSFFQTILRTFAREAELSGNYDVELDNKTAIAVGVNSLFESLTTDASNPEMPRTISWITDYLMDELSSGHSVALFNRSSRTYSNFISFIQHISNEEFAINYDSMMAYLRTKGSIARFRKSLMDVVTQLREDAVNSSRAALEVIASRSWKKGKVIDYVTKTLILYATPGPPPPTKKVKHVVEAADDVSVAYSSDLKKILTANPDPDLDAAVGEACKALSSYWRLEPLYSALAKNTFVLGILEQVYAHVERYRSANNTIILSDTNSILRDIIGDDDTPFVYERIGIWLRHFLIDEFQDTSRMQWDNLYPLLKEGQSAGHDSLIIGDEKQCIYRFRNSDPTLLQHTVPADFSHCSHTFGLTPKENTNWRSSADVVRFNNALFHSIARRHGFTEIYGKVEQEISPAHSTHRGYVDVAFVDKNNYETEALQRMASHIKRQLGEGFAPSDIAVLTRLRDQATRIIEYLMNLPDTDATFPRLRIISDDALIVGSAPSVRLIVSIMRFIATPPTLPSTGKDEEDSTVYYTRPLRELAMLTNRYEFYASIGEDPAIALQRAIEETRNCDSAPTTDDSADIDCFNLPSLVERIIARYVMGSSLMTTDENMYISAFQDLVIDFCSHGNPDLQSFLRWWDERGRMSMVSAPADSGAIRVMTIHKSKGLEFRCVHIPFLIGKIVEFKSTCWFTTRNADTGAKIDLPGITDDIIPPLVPIRPAEALMGTPFEEQYTALCRDQMLDEINVLYVAFTRAVDRLIITSTNEGKNTVGTIISDALVDVDPSCITPDGGIRYGEECPPPARKEKHHTAMEPHRSVNMPPYLSLDRNDLWQNTRLDSLRVSTPEIDRGIGIHKILSLTADIDSLESAVRTATRTGYIKADDSASILESLRSRLANPQVRPWFAGYTRLLCERSLTLADGSHGRPDRVVWTADGYIDVIDYKTGERRDKSYSRQARDYIRALQSMGFTRLRGFIWYLDTDTILTV